MTERTQKQKPAPQRTDEVVEEPTSPAKHGEKI